MTTANILWCAGTFVLVALILAGPARWLRRWSQRQRDALAAARRVRIHLVRTPDEDPVPPRWGRP